MRHTAAYRAGQVDAMRKLGGLPSSHVKSAAVPKFKKDYRRALQTLLEGDVAFHGTTAQGLRGIAASGEIRPGHSQMHQIAGVPDVYFGGKTPAFGSYMHPEAPLVAVPRSRALAQPAVPGPEGVSHPRAFPGNWDSADFPEEYVAVPGKMPLKPKDMIVAPKNQTIPGVREHRLRQIDPKAFQAAMSDVHPKKVEFRSTAAADSPWDPDLPRRQAELEANMGRNHVKLYRDAGEEVPEFLRKWDT